MKTEKKSGRSLNQAFIKNRIQMTAFIIIAAAILVFSVWNAVDLRGGLEAVTREYVSDISKQMTEAIRDTIELKRADLINVADSVTRVSMDTDQEEIAEFMRRKAQILGFDAMILLKAGGEYILSAGAGPDMDAEELLQMAAVQRAFAGWVSTS